MVKYLAVGKGSYYFKRDFKTDNRLTGEASAILSALSSNDQKKWLDKLIGYHQTGHEKYFLYNHKKGYDFRKLWNFIVSHYSSNFDVSRNLIIKNAKRDKSRYWKEHKPAIIDAFNLMQKKKQEDMESRQRIRREKEKKKRSQKK